MTPDADLAHQLDTWTAEGGPEPADNSSAGPTGLAAATGSSGRTLRGLTFQPGGSSSRRAFDPGVEFTSRPGPTT